MTKISERLGVPPIIPQAVQRRLELAFAGFRWSLADGWSREALCFDEEFLDGIDAETWDVYVRHWQQTRPRREG